MNIPEKCLDCDHAIPQLENVHDGYLKFHLDSVVRCDCSPLQFKVGCVCAEMSCIKRKTESENKE